MEHAPAFEVEAVSFSYHGRQPALEQVDLTIAQGEQLVILGANGSGKSTLLKVLDGLYRPDSGRIRAFGEDVTDVAEDPARSRALHRRVGLVFQDPDVQLFCPTVYDDVAFGPLQLGWPDEQVRAAVARALEQMDVGHLSDRAPYELSGGEKKRVAIATVLSMEPEAILLDEPTASLDPRSSDALLDVILGLRRLGKTVVLTTHELEIVPLLATRVVVFGDRERRPVASGTAEAILADEALLVRTNLIHEHLHRHGAYVHSHYHDAAHHDAND
ncbi:MAG TPA: ABC transporter ATP-binding protein [Thermomicrobiaceae bacterium]|nr:ABC transporter ATP-binding protein [Thermomicrobiaceae bacterium]